MHDAIVVSHRTNPNDPPILWGKWQWNQWRQCRERFGYSTSANPAGNRTMSGEVKCPTCGYTNDDDRAICCSNAWHLTGENRMPFDEVGNQP